MYPSLDPVAHVCLIPHRDVTVALGKASAFLASLLSMLADPSVAEPAEFDWTAQQLRLLVSSISDDLTELDDTLDVIKLSPRRFFVRVYVSMIEFALIIVAGHSA